MFCLFRQFFLSNFHFLTDHQACTRDHLSISSDNENITAETAVFHMLIYDCNKL